MIISKVKLKNWKNFSHVEIPLRERMFIVGPNASGKSNFLDVFRFLHDIAKPGGGLKKAIEDRGGITKVRALSARRFPDVEIEVELADFDSGTTLWKYALGFKYSKPSGTLLITFERVWKGEKLILDRPDKEDKKDELRLTQTHIEQMNANMEFREIAKNFESITYFHLVPQLLKFSGFFLGSNMAEDPYGKSFLQRVAKVSAKHRNAWLNKIEGALKVAVPRLKKLEYTEELGVPHLQAVYDHWRVNAAGKQREDQFSDGTLRLIALLWSLLDGGDSLLLLEEPELSLNSAIVAKLAPIIYKLQLPKKRQVVLSTHSVELLQDKGIDPLELAVLSPEKEGTHIRLASSIDEVKLLLDTGMSMGDIIPSFTSPDSIDKLPLFNL